MQCGNIFAKHCHYITLTKYRPKHSKSLNTALLKTKVTTSCLRCVVSVLRWILRGCTDFWLYGMVLVWKPKETKKRRGNSPTPDWREHPALFLGRCGRKAGIWIADNRLLIRSLKIAFVLCFISEFLEFVRITICTFFLNN